MDIEEYSIWLFHDWNFSVMIEDTKPSFWNIYGQNCCSNNIKIDGTQSTLQKVGHLLFVAKQEINADFPFGEEFDEFLVNHPNTS